MAAYFDFPEVTTITEYTGIIIADSSVITYSSPNGNRSRRDHVGVHKDFRRALKDIRVPQNARDDIIFR